MEHDILVEGDNVVAIAFINSDGEIEYNKYQLVDGGCIDSPDSDIGAIIADEAGITEYQDYELHEIE